MDGYCVFFKEKAYFSKHNPKFWSWRGEHRVWKYNKKKSLWNKVQLLKKILKDYFYIVDFNNTKTSTWYEGSFDTSIFIMMFYSCMSFVVLSLRIESATHNLILPLLVVQRERYYCFLIAVKQNEIYYLSVLLSLTNAVSVRYDIYGYFSTEMSCIWRTFCYTYTKDFWIFRNWLYICGSKLLKYVALLSFTLGYKRYFFANFS